MNIFPDILLTTDAHQYGILAQNILQGKGFTLAGNPELIFPPGYSFLLLPFLLLVGPNNAVLALMFASFAFLILGVFLLTKKYVNTVTAILFSTVIALNGNLLMFTLVGYTEIVMFALLINAFYLLDTVSKKRLLFSGLLFGLSYLVKPEALLYVILFFFLQYISKRIQLSKNLLYFAISLIVCVSGYSMYLYSVTGNIALSGKIATLEWDRYVENTSINRDSIMYGLNPNMTLGPSIQNYSLSEVDFYKRIFVNVSTFKQALFELLLPLKYTLPVLFLDLIALKRKWKLLAGVALLNVPIFLIFLFHIENRYLLSILLTTFFVLSYTASHLFDFKKTKNKLSLIIPFLSVISLISLTYYSYYPIRTEFKSLKVQQRETRDWLRENPVSEQIIIARKPVYSFLTSKDYAPIPYSTDKENLARYFDQYKADIILDRWSYYAMPEIHKIIREDFESGKREIVKEKRVLIFENW